MGFVAFGLRSHAIDAARPAGEPGHCYSSFDVAEACAVTAYATDAALRLPLEVDYPVGVSGEPLRPLRLPAAFAAAESAPLALMFAAAKAVVD